jgi:hypothetical protein
LANNPHFLLALRNTILNDVTTSLGTSAIFNIYAGVQPADVSAATTAANTIVAALAFPSTNAFGAAAAGVDTANPITSDSSAAGGTAAWFSFTKSTGLRVVDGSVGTSGADLNLNSVTISTGAAVACSAFTITFAA